MSDQGYPRWQNVTAKRSVCTEDGEQATSSVQIPAKSPNLPKDLNYQECSLNHAFNSLYDLESNPWLLEDLGLWS